MIPIKQKVEIRGRKAVSLCRRAVLWIVERWSGRCETMAANGASHSIWRRSDDSSGLHSSTTAAISRRDQSVVFELRTNIYKCQRNTVHGIVFAPSQIPSTEFYPRNMPWRIQKCLLVAVVSLSATEKTCLLSSRGCSCLKIRYGRRWRYFGCGQCASILATKFHRGSLQ